MYPVRIVLSEINTGEAYVEVRPVVMGVVRVGAQYCLESRRAHSGHSSLAPVETAGSTAVE